MRFRFAHSSLADLWQVGASSVRLWTLYKTPSTDQTTTLQAKTPAIRDGTFVLSGYKCTGVPPSYLPVKPVACATL